MNRKVIFKTPRINARGDVYGFEENQRGWLIDFADNYTIAIVETLCGKILRLPIDLVIFSEWEDDVPKKPTPRPKPCPPHPTI